MHMEEFLEAERLPLRYAGYSTCFRREAGAAGRDTRGILRVHQFDKLEMFSFCLPEQSPDEHELILSVEEEILRASASPTAWSTSPPATSAPRRPRSTTCEAWMPGQQHYREVTSCSNCTDYQARRLNCRYRTEKGPRFVHTLNGTAIAVGRTLIAIMENYQQADGSIAVPEVLVPSWARTSSAPERDGGRASHRAGARRSPPVTRPARPRRSRRPVAVFAPGHDEAVHLHVGEVFSSSVLTRSRSRSSSSCWSKPSPPSARS